MLLICISYMLWNTCAVCHMTTHRNNTCKLLWVWLHWQKQVFPHWPYVEIMHVWKAQRQPWVNYSHFNKVSEWLQLGKWNIGRCRKVLNEALFQNCVTAILLQIKCSKCWYNIFWKKIFFSRFLKFLKFPKFLAKIVFELWSFPSQFNIAVTQGMVFC